jgi:hypothetical protein
MVRATLEVAPAYVASLGGVVALPTLLIRCGLMTVAPEAN